MKKTLFLSVFLLSCFMPAKAFFLGGFIRLATLPVKIPLKFVSFVGKKTTKVAAQGTKSALENISISSGPIKIRPFDFKS